MNQLESRYLDIKHQIKQFCLPHQDVNLLAVSKYHHADKIIDLYQLGQTRFGESYVKEAIEKIELLKNYPIEWHFIGPMQSNKTKLISQNFTWVHSVDRLKIAQRLNNHLTDTNKQLNICLQVNINEEEQKSGFLLHELEEAIIEINKMPQLNLRGLMAIPEKTSDPLQQAKNFRCLKKRFDELNHHLNLTMDTLSMGMSGDMQAAIEEGSTIIRIGTGLFGERAY